MIWMDPMPSAADLAIAYEQYYTHADKDSSQSRASKLLLTLLGIQSERRQIETFYLEQCTPGRVLEVGFGDGRRLSRLAQLGWQTEGQEIDPVAVDKARKKGHKVYLGPLEDLQLEGKQFDAIVGNHVIEHVPDPVAMLRECLRLLKPGGHLIMLTPDTGSFGHRFFRRNWLAIDTPRHIFLFSSNNLKSIAAAAGLTKVETISSNARNLIPFHASLEIRKHGKYDFQADPGLIRQLSVAALVALARIAQLTRLTSGEELVLFAQRPETA